MIAVSLNVGGGVRRIKPAKLCMCTQKHYKHNEDGRTAPGVCGNGSVPGDVVTRIGIHTGGWAQHHPYLGVKLTSDLIWKTHIANISGKAKQNSQPSQAPLLRLQSRIQIKDNYHSSPPPPRVFIDGMGPLL